MFRLAPDGRLRELVPAPENLMGRPLAEWMGADFMEFVAEADVPQAREMLARVLEGETPSPFVVRFRSPGGELRHVEFTVMPDEEDGRIVGVVGLANGVTLRREAEAKAAHFERLLLSSQQITHVGSWEWNKDTGEVVWSDELYRIFGLHPQQEKVTIERLLAPLPPEEQARARGEARESVDLGRPFTFDHQIVRPDGQTRTLEVRGEVVRDEKGRVFGLIGTCQDVTERREREELIQAYLEVGENLPIGAQHLGARAGDPPQPVLVQYNRRAMELGAQQGDARPHAGRPCPRGLRDRAARPPPGGGAHREGPDDRAARPRRPRLFHAHLPRARGARGRRLRRRNGARARPGRPPAGEGGAAAARGERAGDRVEGRSRSAGASPS